MMRRFTVGFVGGFGGVLRHLVLGVAVIVSQGCTTGGVANVITGLTFSDLSQRPNPDCDSADAQARARCTPEVRESLLFAQTGKEVVVIASGTGRCEKMSVDFGDGTPAVSLTSLPIDRTGGVRVPHTYNGWPGKKLVRVKGETGCLGDVTKEIMVGLGADGRDDFRLALVPNTMSCNRVANTAGLVLPALRKGTGIKLTATGKIRYGVIEFDASGDRSGTTTPSDYAFPAQRVFSIVYKFGSSFVQGEAGDKVFLVPETAPLEVCVNDHPSLLRDNIGGMLFVITVNEISAQ